MTLIEAMVHCEDVAEQQFQKALKTQTDAMLDDDMRQKIVAECEQCAADHIRLTTWLNELSEMRPLFDKSLEMLDVLCDKVSCKTSCSECGLGDESHTCMVRALIQDMKDVKTIYAEESKGQ